MRVRSATACAAPLALALALLSAPPAAAARRSEARAVHGSHAAAAAVAAALALGNRLLSIGDSGPDVVQLQQLLTQRGFRVAADGIFGPLTQAAVERAQRAYHVTVDGVVGPVTLAALRRGAPGSSAARGLSLGQRLLRIGATGPDVVALQKLLSQRGFKVSADGIFGPLTQAAVERAQRAYHVTVDGVVGPVTLGALRRGPPPHSPSHTQSLGSRVLAIGMRGRDVRALQQLLTRRGFRVTADGDFGPETRAAVEAAQGAYHLTADGIVGPLTLGALRGGAPRRGSCGSTPGAGDAVTRWTPVVSCVLGLLGQPRTNAYIDDVLIVIRYESGGNPDAINLWDSNARAGDPSRGLMQLIGTNFAYYRSPSLPDNIYDPAANIYAALRYALARYGSIPNIPGVKSIDQGHGYVPYQPIVVRRHRFARALSGGLTSGLHGRRAERRLRSRA